MNKVLVTTLAVMLVVGGLAVTGVGQDDYQVLKLSEILLDSVNPTLMMGRPGNMQVCSLMYDSMVIIDANFSPKPEIAESWERPDDTTWIFNIREGMTWQDGNEIWAEGEGRAVTAHDVVFAYGIHAKYSMPLQSTFNRILSVTALDDYTVEIKTDGPMHNLITGTQTLTMAPIFPPEAVTEFENGADVLPIGSGPFELQEFVAGSKAILTKNEDYWIEVKLDEVQKIVINDPAARVIAFEAGEVDYLQSAPLPDAPRLLDLGFLRVGTFGGWRGIGFNVTKAPYDDYRVREGISLLLDVDSAWQAIVPEGLGVRSYGQQGPWNPYNYDPEGLMDFDRFDIDEGLSMLADAGWTDSDGDGWLDKNGEKFSANIKTWGGDQVQVLTILATQLQQVGIDAQVQVLETATYAQDLATGNSDIFFDYTYSSNTGLYALFHSSKLYASNTHFLEDPIMDLLLDAAMAQADPEIQGQYFKAAQRLAVANRYIIGMYYSLPSNFVYPYVKEFVAPYGFLELVNVERNVYIEKD